MALTDDQAAFFDSKLGPGTWDPADLEARLTRTGSEVYAAREVLEGRLAAFSAQPAQYTLPGDYQQSTQANISALRETLKDLPAPPLPPPPDGGSGGAAAAIIRPDTRRWAR